MEFKQAQRLAHDEADKSGLIQAVVAVDPINDEFKFLELEAAKRAGFRPRYLAQPGKGIYSEFAAACEAFGHAILSKAEWKLEGSLTYADYKTKHGITDLKPLTKTQIIDGITERPVRQKRIARAEGDPPTKGVTRQVWEIADGLLNGNKVAPTRKEVTDAAVAAGVNLGTANVQYGKWRHAKGFKK